MSSPKFSSQEVVLHNGRDIKLLPRTLRPPIWEHTMHPNTKRDNFYLYSHSAHDMAHAVTKFVTSPPDADRQAAIDGYFALSAPPDLLPENVVFLMTFLRLFDRIFFFGALTSRHHCYIDFEPIRSDIYGDCTTHQNIEFPLIDPRYECRIRLRDVSRESSFQDPSYRLGHYVRVVLHEAIHALFGLYVCRSCQACIDDAEYNLEYEGHGRVWQDVAFLVEDYAARLGLGEINLRRQESLWTCAEFYLAQCTEEELNRWGLLRYRSMQERRASRSGLKFWRVVY